MSAIENFLENVKARTKSRNPSVTELARRIGLHRVSVHKLLAGQHEPTLSTVEAIASALGVPIQKLLAEPRQSQVKHSKKSEKLLEAV